MVKHTQKRLVVFYSQTGNTRFIAERIARAAKADMLEIRTRDGRKVARAAGGMQAIRKYRPEILPCAIDPQAYDLVFIGTPVWGFTNAPAINTFLAGHELKEKDMALFCCYGGLIGRTFIELEKALAGKNRILGKFGFREPLSSGREASGEQVDRWIDELGLGPAESV